MQKLVVGSKYSAIRNIAGFTLLEMLVVLTIVGLSLALVVPAASKSMVVSVHDIARDMQMSLRQVRAKAVTQQSSTLFWLDMEQHTYLNHKNSAKSFPKDIQVHAKVADAETQSGKAGVRFYPDGSSTGGRFTISQNNVNVYINIDWLTGRVSVTDEG